jgi:hypothetical protein
MENIRVEILGAESFGVRSMCTAVRTPDVSLLLDPGCALGPRREHEIPHPEEYKALHAITDRIVSASQGCTGIFISHYHHDHFKPRLVDEVYIHAGDEIAVPLYLNHDLYLKAGGKALGTNQRNRCRDFRYSMGRVARVLHDADFTRYRFGDTIVDFSPPVPHGEQGTKLGHIVMARIRHGADCFVFAPDVQGPVVEDTVKFMLDVPPAMAFLGGPPYYLGEKLTRFQFEAAEANLARLHERVPVLVVDHHCCRDRGAFQAMIERVSGCTDGTNQVTGNVIESAAGFMGVEPAFLESDRVQLYTDQPPSTAFLDWIALPRERRLATIPPTG